MFIDTCFCQSLFFEFPWNNFLHSVVYDMIAKVFNTYSFTSQSSNFSAVGPDGVELVTDGIVNPLEEKMKEVSIIFKKLVVSVCFLILVLVVYGLIPPLFL